MPDQLLAGVVRSLLRGSNWYNSSRLMKEGLDSTVSQVQKNIVGNIESILEFPIVSEYLFTAVVEVYFESKLPVNVDFANNRQNVDWTWTTYKLSVESRLRNQPQK